MLAKTEESDEHYAAEITEDGNQRIQTARRRSENRFDKDMLATVNLTITDQHALKHCLLVEGRLRCCLGCFHCAYHQQLAVMTRRFLLLRPQRVNACRLFLSSSSATGSVVRTAGPRGSCRRCCFSALW